MVNPIQTVSKKKKKNLLETQPLMLTHEQTHIRTLKHPHKHIPRAPCSNMSQGNHNLKLLRLSQTSWFIIHRNSTHLTSRPLNLFLHSEARRKLKLQTNVLGAYSKPEKNSERYIGDSNSSSHRSSSTYH